MSLDKYHSAGSCDPAIATALSALEKEDQALQVFWPIVYICSPFSGDVERNVNAAQHYSRFAAAKGFIPIAPHLLFPQFLNDDIPAERQLGLFFGNILMSKCAEVWVFGSNYSAGMMAEIKRAKRKNYHLRYFSEDCEEIQDVCNQ